MRPNQPDQASAVVVIFITDRGVEKVQVHSSKRGQAEGLRLYDRLLTAVDRLDRVARKGATA